MTPIQNPGKTVATPNESAFRTGGSTPAHALAGTTSPAATLIRRHVTDDQICILTFDRPDSTANVLDHATLLELDQHLTYLSSNTSLKGVVVTSAKKGIFIAGADLTQLAKARTNEELGVMIDLGQGVLNRLAALPMPTVAAIHGACLGGGYEVTLACDYRMASPDKATKLGLPETQLGILPAWGGSTRLPRLIGYPKALDLILTGKTPGAKEALKAGLIDAIVPGEYLVNKACSLLLSKGSSLKERAKGWPVVLVNLPPIPGLLARRVRKDLDRKSRGNYPALTRALDVVTRGLGHTVEGSLALEREAILHLGQTEACRNLIRLFFLQERARKMSPPCEAISAAQTPEPVCRIAVIGAGVMGAAIAQWNSARGIHVTLRDLHVDAVAKGMTGIARLYEEAVKRHALTPIEARAGLDRVVPTAEEVPLQGMDLILEAAVERLDLKQQLFTALGAKTGPGTVLATNTSALSITKIAERTSHPERVIGIHFFNPVHRMQLVEVVVGRQTSAATVRRAVRYVQQIGKFPIVVQDSPGFLVNRILMPYLVEAGHLFEHGARAEDLDECMLDFGMPMGPLRLLDEVGLDVANHVAGDLAARFSDRMQSPGVLGRMLQDGLLGKKSGKGFYAHERKGRETVNPEVDRYAQDASYAQLTREELSNRMVMMMINEATRCLEEGVVAEAADVDFGMILGTGFAPFRGGPLRFADTLGAPQLVAEMMRLAAKGELRFTPCNLLQSMAASGRQFYGSPAPGTRTGKAQ